jgi:hypothetical protein
LKTIDFTLIKEYAAKDWMKTQVNEPQVLDLLQSKGYLFSSHKSGHINVFEVSKQNLLTK